MTRGEKLFSVVGSTAVLLVASISVALYYNITFFGKAVVALPSVPVASGCLFYYLCAFNTTPPLLQVVLWMGSFVLSGWLWWFALDRVFPGLSSHRRWRSLLIYALPLPWLLWIHAQSPAGMSWDAFLSAILVRDNLYWNSEGSEKTLNALYLGLAAFETFDTLILCQRVSGQNWRSVLVRFTLASLACLATLCLTANLIAMLR